MWPNSQFHFSVEEILNGKLDFFVQWVRWSLISVVSIALGSHIRKYPTCHNQDYDSDYVEWSWVVTIHYLVLYLLILFCTTFDPLNKFIFEPMENILP